jgi:hypothetical protein
MKLYTISELEQLTTEEINDILQSRCKLRSKMINYYIKGKKIQSNCSKIEEIYGKKEKTFFNIKDIQYHEKDRVSFSEDVIIAPTNVYLDGYNSKGKIGSVYQDYSTSELFTGLLEKYIGKDTRTHWGLKKYQGQNYVNFDLLFPAKFIIPDIVAFSTYQNSIKKSKKPSPKINENLKKELEAKLITQIEEIKNNRFNLLKENNYYVPDNKDDLMELIKKASKAFDQETLNAVVKKYPDNEEIVLATIGFMNDHVFEYASERLKDSKEFVSYCIDNLKGNIFAFASERLRDDETLMLKAIESVGGQIMRAASDRLKNNKEIALFAIKNQACAYQEISEELKSDEEVISILIEQPPDFFKPAPIIKSNKALLIKAFKTAYPDNSGLLLRKTSEELRNDADVALAAIKCNEKNIEYIGEKLKEEMGDFEPFAYLKNITLYKDMNTELTNDSNNVKRKMKM